MPAGLPVYPEPIRTMGLAESVRRHVTLRGDSQGWTDEQMVFSVIVPNPAGGELVDDLGILDGDEGLCRLMRRVEAHGMSRQARRAQKRRWRKKRERTFPSPSATFRYLMGFHDREQEKLRQPGKAFIPVPNEHLRGLAEVNGDLMAFVQSRRPERTATLDMDATLVETSKAEALYCYKKFKAYQPLNTYWAEQELVLHSEFRDGNVPAGYEQRRVLAEALELLPEGVEKVCLRSDTAGYEWRLLKYCAEGRNERFGVIEFAVGVDVTAEFRKAVVEVEEKQWRPLRKEVGGELVETGQQWAEVCFVPNEVGRSEKGPEYRFLAIREPLKQLELAGIGEQQSLPFPTVSFSERGRYKLSGIVTNRDIDGEELIRWYGQRCGKSEQVHAVMKEDLAGGKLPTGNFGANAAWWWMMVLALNLNVAMKRLVLGKVDKGWESKRMKAVRFGFINLPARVLEHSRRLILRLSKGHPGFELLVKVRGRILMLRPEPGG